MDEHVEVRLREISCGGVFGEDCLNLAVIGRSEGTHAAQRPGDHFVLTVDQAAMAHHKLGDDAGARAAIAAAGESGNVDSRAAAERLLQGGAAAVAAARRRLVDVVTGHAPPLGGGGPPPALSLPGAMRRSTVRALAPCVVAQLPARSLRRLAHNGALYHLMAAASAAPSDAEIAANSELGTWRAHEVSAVLHRCAAGPSFRLLVRVRAVCGKFCAQANGAAVRRTRAWRARRGCAGVAHGYGR